ncbi:MAG TPA: flagellar filament capping protein FliD, partial [Thermodesulfobacteriota bacterium]|nr:flagellar filament capping protein FliD [Thermodesulfobacteriota bacterium]
AVRSVTTTPYNDTTLTLLGLTHDKNGVLSIDSSKFDSALSENEADVVKTINDMASALGSQLDSYIDELIPARKNGYEQTVKGIQKDQDSLVIRLELKELAFRKQFINLDKLLSQLQGTSSFLEQQIENLGKISGGNK